MTSELHTYEDASVTVNAWGCTNEDPILKPFTYHPRPLGPKDVEVEISHSSICRTDVHLIDGDWGPLKHTCVPGHEIAGKVAAIGSNVTHLQVGDSVAVGTVADSCGECKFCKSNGDRFCSKRAMIISDTYKDGLGGVTYGGFADRVRLKAKFAFKIPSEISPAEAAPLLCAGITVFAPLRNHGAGPDKSVGIVGIGGLGHLAVQFARAMGSKQVVAFSTSDKKREEATQLGATQYVNVKNPEELKAAARSVDVLLVTSVTKDTNWGELMEVVETRGTLVLIGIPPSDIVLPFVPLLYRELSVAGSFIGSAAQVKEMLEFSAKHNVRPWITKMPFNDPNPSMEIVRNGSPRYRIVLEREPASQ
ncbi:putative mannitol dehydrogenase [Mortierella sp. GBAus27b]|nr:putative mannitol dehydrogenase [Mortierella sp. GBAus27b]